MASVKSTDTKPRVPFRQKATKSATEQMLEDFKLLNPLAVRVTKFSGIAEVTELLLPDETSEAPFRVVGMEQAALLNRSAIAAEEIRSLKARINKRIPDLEGLQDATTKEAALSLLSEEQMSLIRLSNKDFNERRSS